MNTNLIIFTLVSLFLSVKVHSKELQDYTAEERSEALTEWMIEHLDIGDEKFESVADLNLEYALMNDAIYNGEGSKMSKLWKIRSNLKQKEDKLREVIGNNSFQIYEKYKSKLKTEIQKRLKSKESKSL